MQQPEHPYRDARRLSRRSVAALVVLALIVIAVGITLHLVGVLPPGGNRG